MICVKCYIESQNGKHHINEATPLVTQMHADFIYNGMSLCQGHFNRQRKEQ